MKPFYEDEKAGIVMYCADNRGVLPMFDDGSFNLILTSPPYNLREGMGARGELRIGHNGSAWARGHLQNGYDGHGDDLPYAEYVRWQGGFLLECWRLIDDGGAIFYNHKPRVVDGEVRLPTALIPELSPGKTIPLRQVVIWDRGGGFNCMPGAYMPKCEWLLILAKEGFYLRDRAASAVGDVWRIPAEMNTDHPAPFPLALAAQVMETTTSTTVLDPFCGSGTTLVAAYRAGRKAIGIERSEEYCEQAVWRLKREKGIASDRPRKFVADKPSPLFDVA